MSKESNVVFVGKKPPMAYVLAVLTSMSTPDTKEVLLKARGRSITTAVDVAEIVRRRFVRELEIGSINIGTERVEQEEGGSRAVSTIEISLKNIATEAAIK